MSYNINTTIHIHIVCDNFKAFSAAVRLQLDHVLADGQIQAARPEVGAHEHRDVSKAELLQAVDALREGDS